MNKKKILIAIVCTIVIHLGAMDNQETAVKNFTDAYSVQDPVANAQQIAIAFEALPNDIAHNAVIGFASCSGENNVPTHLVSNPNGFIIYGSNSPFLPVFLRKFLLPAVISKTRAKKISSAARILAQVGVFGFETETDINTKKELKSVTSDIKDSPDKCLSFIDAFANKRDNDEYSLWDNPYASAAPDRFHLNLHKKVVAFKKCVLAKAGLKACIQECGLSGAAAYFMHTPRGQAASIGCAIACLATASYFIYQAYTSKKTDAVENMPNTEEENTQESVVE